MKKKIKYDGANWNHQKDQYTQFFYEQNLSQFWRPEDISLQPDINLWSELPKEIKKAYAQNLLTLTFLDTYQGDIGMPVLSRSLDDKFHQKKAVINFMAAMENAVHAKSYSNIFMTYLSPKEIDDLFLWGEKQQNLQKIIEIIVNLYKELDQIVFLKKYQSHKIEEKEFLITQWKTMCASVFLETWLFYSGFYYPLFFYGQGKLMQAGEIINLIIRDESIHGLYVGRLAQEIYEKFDIQLQKKLYNWLVDISKELYQEQLSLIKEIYQPLNLEKDVQIFARYNCNKAFMNLGFDSIFPEEEVNPVIINGLNTETKTMDNFSMKGNGYQKMKSESLKNEDFIFKNKKIS